MDKLNNLNILRLIFASTVIISHSFPLTNNDEIFQTITKRQIDLGGLSVEIFFIISGYLIYKSLNFSKSILSYIWKRLLRIFPAVIVMLIFTMLILIIISNSTTILLQKDYYTYFFNNLSLYRVQFYIKGIFENNPYPKSINGSIWTLSYEFSMYLFLIPLHGIKNKKYSLALILLFFILFSFLHVYKPLLFNNLFNYINLNSEQFYRLSKFFLAGSLLTFVDLDKIKSNRNIIILILFLLLSLYFNIYTYTSILILPFLVLIIGFSYNKTLWNFTEKIGDLSYGIYIYGFLVQQTLMNYFELNPLELMIYALIISSIFAYMSWHLIEEKAMKYKNLI